MGNKSARQHALWREAEIGERLPDHGWARVAAVYPQRYNVAAANLGYQWLCHALAEAGLEVRRLVFPEPAVEVEAVHDTLRVIEDDGPAADAAVWFVSLSFENDLVRLAAMLRLSGLDPRATHRTARDPLIVAGGIVPSLNPEPVSDLADVCLLGDGEALLGPFVDYLKTHGDADRDTLLAGLKDVPGAYVGRHYVSRWDVDGRLAAVEPIDGFPERVRVVKVATLDPEQTRQRWRAPGAAFGDSLLIETARGCVNRCRFCAAGHLFLPYRPASPPPGKPDLGQHVAGLIGSNVSGHPDLEAWLEWAGDDRVALASIRRGTLDDDQWRRLVGRGLVSAAIAPEAGSERLRRVINKPASDEQILDEVRRAVGAGVKNLKLYFLLGLPGETAADVDAIVSLTQRAREAAMAGWHARKWAGRLAVSVNPLIPKPHTPFQWHAFGDPDDLKKRVAAVRSGLRRTANVDFQAESLREATLQALLSIGDRRAGRLVRLIDQEGGVRAGLRAWDVDRTAWLMRPRPVDAALPWDCVDAGVTRRYLADEYEKALREETSPPCRVGSGCRLCGVCE